MTELDRTDLIELTLAGSLGIAAALFLHDSGATLLQILHLGARSLLLPLLLSMVLAYVLEPAVSGLERRGVGRLTGVLLLFTLMLAIFSVGSLVFFPVFRAEVSLFHSELPRYGRTLIQVLNGGQIWLREEFGVFADLDLNQKVGGVISARQGDLVAGLIEIGRTFLSLFIFVPLFCFFFLCDGPAAKRAVVRNMPNRYFESTLTLMHQLDLNMGSFIRGRFYEASIVGILVTAGLWIVGLKYFWVFGILAALTNLVPFLGPFLSTLLAASFALLDTGSWMRALTVLGIFLFVRLLDNFILVPTLITRSVSLHFMTGILAIILGGIAMGVLGMIIALPVASLLKLVFIEVKRHWLIGREPYGVGAASL